MHRINRVAKLTGLSRDVIRVWERRHGLLSPQRGSNRYRQYSDEDVALLRFIRAEMEQGQAIGELAAAGREKLLRRMRATTKFAEPREEAHQRTVADLAAALEPLNRTTFERRLNDLLAVLPFKDALLHVLLPLQVRVGDLWHEGRISEAVEHYVTRQVQKRVFAMMSVLPVGDEGLRVVVGCPPGEEHDVGAQAVAYLSSFHGCRTFYLGANVPMAALRRLCVDMRADLVLLSLVMRLTPEAAAALAHELGEQIVPLGRLWMGGRGAAAIRSELEEANIEVMDSLEAFEQRLVSRRRVQPASRGRASSLRAAKRASKPIEDGRP